MSTFAASVCDSARAPSNDARRTNAERRREQVLDALAVGGGDDPVAHRDVDAEVAHPADGLVLGAGCQRRAPTAIEA